MRHHPPLQPVLTDTASAHELRAMITSARARLHEVLHDRSRTRTTVSSWTGPHRERYDVDAADLLATGRVLDDALRDLLTALDAEIAVAGG